MVNARNSVRPGTSISAFRRNAFAQMHPALRHKLAVPATTYDYLINRFYQLYRPARYCGSFRGESLGERQ